MRHGQVLSILQPVGSAGVAWMPPRRLTGCGWLVMHPFSPSSEYGSGDNTMTNGTNRILDEFAKMVTDAAGAAQGVRREFETVFRSQAERMLNSMDLVQREDFEAVREMAVKAREENMILAARIEALEEKLAEKTVKKPAPKA